MQILNSIYNFFYTFSKNGNTCRQSTNLSEKTKSDLFPSKKIQFGGERKFEDESSGESEQLESVSRGGSESWATFRSDLITEVFSCF